VFTVEQRDALRDRLLRLAEDDERVVAAAVVGSLAAGTGDRYSDLDLTFAVDDDVPVAEVCADRRRESWEMTTTKTRSKNSSRNETRRSACRSWNRVGGCHRRRNTDVSAIRRS
jgi:hypothetical protein